MQQSYASEHDTFRSEISRFNDAGIRYFIAKAIQGELPSWLVKTASDVLEQRKKADAPTSTKENK